MRVNRILALSLLVALVGCQAEKKSQDCCSALVAKGDWTLPYEQWEFAFLTPNALPATVTRVGIIDTESYLYDMRTLDGTHDDPASVGSWSKIIRSGSVYFNKARQPPQYMIFCWDSIIDKKSYETSLFFPESVWKKMMTPAEYKSRSGRTVWYRTMLFGLAPEGKVRVWLQDVGDHPNYPVAVEKLKTVSGDQMTVCKGITQSDFSYGYDQDIKDFIKGKTYPYGSW